MELAEKIGFPYKLLGEGSNILVSESGFDGLIIVNHTHKIDFDLTLARSPGYGRFRCEYGYPFPQDCRTQLERV